MNDFIEFLGHGIEGSQTCLQAFYPNMKPAAVYIKSQDEYDHWVKRYNHNAQMYIALNPIREGSRQFPKDEDVAYWCNEYIDLDCEKPKEFKGYNATDDEMARLEPTVEKINNWLTEHGFKQGYCDMTGNGRRWILPIPPLKLDDIDLKELVKKKKAFKERIAGDCGVTPGCGAHMDSVFDLKRITGMPGTENVKNATDDRPCRIREPFRDAVRDEDQNLRDYIMNIEITQLSPREAEHQKKNTHSAAACDLDIWMAKDPKLKRLVSGDMSGYASPSEMDMALACKLVFYRFNESDIERILISVPGSDAAKKEKSGNHQYVTRTVDKAFEFETERVSDTHTRPQNADGDTQEMTWAEIAELQHNEFDLRLSPNLPKDHFISIFTRWMQTITDGYTDYAITCGLWILSAIATEKTVLKLKQGHVRPNLWIANLGRSTTSRKSTIINKSRRMFESATDVTLPNEDFSLEGYLETLAINPVMNNVRDEMSGLMAKYHKKYNDGIFDLECVLYDCEGVQKTLASGKNREPKTFSVRNPRITKLYATTPVNFSRYMSIDDFSCGYGVRFLFASPQYKHDRQALSLETEEDISLWGDTLMRIKQLRSCFDNIDGEITFTATRQALDYYDNVCQSLEEYADGTNNDMLNTVIGRSETHILKIAMLLEIGKQEASNVIDIEMMQVACDMVTTYFIPCIMDVVERLEEDIKNNHIEKLIAILRRLGGVATHVKLLRDSHLPRRDFNEAVETMRESQTVAVVTNAESKAKVYRLLSHNAQNDFRNIRKVRNVRTFADPTHTSANIANITKNDNKSKNDDDVCLATHTTPSTTLCERANFANFANVAKKDQSDQMKSIDKFFREHMDSDNKIAPVEYASREQLVEYVPDVAEQLHIGKDVAFRLVMQYGKDRGWI